jgi:predicted SprT family Zn-dependent metalloprotease
MNTHEFFRVPGKNDDTKKMYDGFCHAFDWFNKTLFDGQLPGVIITLQRKKGAFGYFHSSQFNHRHKKEIKHEIALNPALFGRCTDQAIADTLVHEMVHLWQQHLGKPPKNAYHNQEWAKKMIEVGLMPSTTGKPGGKQTGKRVSDYPIEGGPFEKEWQKLEASGFKFDYQGLEVSSKGKDTRKKISFSCPECSIKVLARQADLRIMCMDCMEQMTCAA